MRRDRTNAEHYYWGNGCEGWIIGPSQEMMIIHERMPAGSEETCHFHREARQFFYVLDGELTMQVDDAIHVLPANSGIEIAPGSPHQARNDSGADVHFLVASSPSARGDRVDLAR